MIRWRGLRGDRRGSILPLSLGALLMVSVLALGASSAARVGLRLAEYRWEEIRLTQAAKAAVAACAALCRGSNALVTALNQPWSADAAFFKDHPVLEGSFTVHRPPSGHGLTDEEGKINLNTASPEELARVFREAPQCVAPLLDWRDADSVPRAGGAETGYYESLPFPYPCRNGPLRSLSELRLVKGVTGDVFRGIDKLVTVSGTGRVNINTAGPEVLKFLGMKDSFVDKVLSYRAGSDGLAGTGDDGVFPNLAAVTDGRLVLTAEEKDLLTGLLGRDRLSVRSSAFRGQFEVRLEDRRAGRRIDAVFDADKGRIDSWREEP